MTWLRQTLFSQMLPLNCMLHVLNWYADTSKPPVTDWASGACRTSASRPRRVLWMWTPQRPAAPGALPPSSPCQRCRTWPPTWRMSRAPSKLALLTATRSLTCSPTCCARPCRYGLPLLAHPHVSVRPPCTAEPLLSAARASERCTSVHAAHAACSNGYCVGAGHHCSSQP